MTERSRGTGLLTSAALAFPVGAVVFAVVAFAYRTPWGTLGGIPWNFSIPLACTTPNPLNGCGYYYSLPLLLADYLFWVAVSFLALLGVGLWVVRAPGGPQPPGSE